MIFTFNNHIKILPKKGGEINYWIGVDKKSLKTVNVWRPNIAFIVKFTKQNLQGKAGDFIVWDEVDRIPHVMTSGELARKIRLSWRLPNETRSYIKST